MNRLGEHPANRDDIATKDMTVERTSRQWLWIGLGVVAVVILVASGLGRRRLDVPLLPDPAEPIIVEPIQPSAAVAPLTGPSAPEPLAMTPPAPIHLATSTSNPEAARPLPPEGAERVRQIQQALHQAGFDPGPVDGRIGRWTQKAIREFQEAHSLSVDGTVGPKTWAALEPYLHTDMAAAGAN